MALQDKIGREEIVDKICGLVGSLKKDKNFCLAINGAWGSGKSFVLGLIEEKLSNTFSNQYSILTKQTRANQKKPLKEGENAQQIDLLDTQ